MVTSGMPVTSPTGLSSSRLTSARSLRHVARQPRRRSTCAVWVSLSLQRGRPEGAGTAPWGALRREPASQQDRRQCVRNDCVAYRHATNTEVPLPATDPKQLAASVLLPHTTVVEATLEYFRKKR